MEAHAEKLDPIKDVRIHADNYLLINGKPFFTRGHIWMQQNFGPFLDEPFELLAEIRLIHAQLSVASADCGLAETVFSVVSVNIPAKVKDAVGMAEPGKPRHSCGKFTQFHCALPNPFPALPHPLQED